MGFTYNIHFTQCAVCAAKKNGPNQSYATLWDFWKWGAIDKSLEFKIQISTSFPTNFFIIPDSSLGRVLGFGMKGHGFNPRWRNFLFILWVFRFISKTSQESQVNLNFVDYALLCLRLFAISISPQSEERQVWPVGCLRAGCKIGRHQKWQRRLILKNHTLCNIFICKNFSNISILYRNKRLSVRTCPWL